MRIEIVVQSFQDNTFNTMEKISGQVEAMIYQKGQSLE
jgi:hypothetical protein